MPESPSPRLLNQPIVSRSPDERSDSAPPVRQPSAIAFPCAGRKESTGMAKVRLSASPPLHRQGFEAAEVIGVAGARALGEPQSGEAREQDRQRRRQFEPRQRRPDAEVNAGAERQVGI